MTKQQIHQYGHWTCPVKFDANDYVGFIYRITNMVTGKMYIGRKNFTSTRRKQVKLKTDPSRKKTQVVKSPSDWMTYTGSSKTLNEDISELGINKFKFEILSLHRSLSSLNYAETYTLIHCNALTSYFKNGMPAYYNGLIPPVRTRPKLEGDD